MKLEKETYRRTFSQLKASPALRKELLAMTEKTEKTRKPKKFVLRRLAIAAAVMALACALAMGANAATGGELYEVTIGKLVCTLSTDDGGEAELYENENGGFVIIEHPGDEEGASEDAGDGDTVYAKSYEVEVDEEGNATLKAGGREEIVSAPEK